jgi:DNA-binding transcriptional regulator YdaS (Cro superfamily)
LDVVFGGGRGIIVSVPAPSRPAQKILDQNAELAARLKVSEESLRQLKASHEQLQAEHAQAHFPHISECISGNFPPGDLSGRTTRAR